MATITNPIIDVDRETGEMIAGWPRIKQSITTILTTRLNTRVMRLNWGSSFLDAQDKPGNQQIFMESLFAAAEAINLYEPEFRVTSVLIPEWGADGLAQIEVYGTDLTTDADRRFIQTL